MKDTKKTSSGRPLKRELTDLEKINKWTSRKGNCWDNAPIGSFFGHIF